MRTKAEMLREKDGELSEEQVSGALNSLFFMMGMRNPVGEGFIPGRDGMTEEERKAADLKRYEDDCKWGIEYAKHDIKKGKWTALFWNKRFYHIETIQFITLCEVGNRPYLAFYIRFENGYEMTLLANTGKAHVSRYVWKPDEYYDDKCVMELQSA